MNKLSSIHFIHKGTDGHLKPMLGCFYVSADYNSPKILGV